MTEALYYTLGSSLFLIAGYLCYKCALSEFRQPAFNRAIIMVIYMVSAAWFIIPEIRISTVDPSTASIIGSARITTGLSRTTGARSLPWGTIAAWIWIAGIVFLSAKAILGTISLMRYIRHGERICHDGYTLIITDDSNHSPFSWNNYIVISRDDMENGTMIIRHELAHIEHRHIVDIMIANLFCIFQWFNPAAWLMKSELRSIHEYQADEDVINSGANIRDYQFLLIKKAVGNRFHQLTNSLNHSQLKKRLTMMEKSKSKFGAKLCAAIIAPAMLAAAAVINIPTVASAMDVLKPHKDNGSMLIMQTKINAPSIQCSESATCTSGNPEVMPEYPGGEAQMMMFLIKNMTYPKEAIKKGVDGDVSVHFCIDTNGSVTDVRVPQSVDPSLDAEAIRVVKLMPRWKPGKKDGKPVKTDVIVPVRFRLEK